MHSIKNTIVAVGLLGLSFLFYQASSNKTDDTDGMIPALNIDDGLDGMKQLATDSMDVVKSKAESFSGIEMPKIDAPNIQIPDLATTKQMASDFAANAGQSINGKTTELKNNAQDFANDFSNQFAKPNASANNLSAPKLELPTFNPQPNPQPKSSSRPSTDFGANDFSSATSQPTNRKPLDTVARDEGLMAALNQNKIASNSFATQPVSTGPSTPSNSFAAGNNFGSQPIPPSDNSFNALASDVSTKRDTDVVQAGSDPDPANLGFQSAWPHVQKLSDEGKYRDALRLLSRYYRSTDLTGPQQQRLVAWLDALAGKVIFSEEHNLHDMPYTVANESLVDIGKRWRVPAQLIYNVNRSKIANPAAVAGGTQLKVIEGPFDAEIDTQQKIMTLFLDDLYAGRFPIRVGISGDPNPGNFRVLVKSPVGHDWRDDQGNTYPPGNAKNGYGPNWIGLSGSLCIHEIKDNANDGHRGCIGLSAKDANDVFAILTEGSNVKIIR